MSFLDFIKKKGEDPLSGVNDVTVYKFFNMYYHLIDYLDMNHPKVLKEYMEQNYDNIFNEYLKNNSEEIVNKLSTFLKEKNKK